MYKTFKRIVSKHTTEEDIIAWKGFLLGVIIAVFIISPTITLCLIFIFGEHLIIDDIIIKFISDFFM